MLMLYIWMVNTRLLKDIEDDKLIQECLFDELWEDTSKRLRALKITELLINKNLREVQFYSFRFCLELDFAIAPNVQSIKDDEEEGVNATDNKTVTDSSTRAEQRSIPIPPKSEEHVIEGIGHILWRMLYLENPKVPAALILHFAE